MATKSFLKNVSIRGERQSKEFIRALEKSKSKKSKEVTLSRPVSDMTKEEAKHLFGEKENERV